MHLVSDIPPHTKTVDPVVQDLALTDMVVEAAVTTLLLSFAIQAHKRSGTLVRELAIIAPSSRPSEPPACGRRRGCRWQVRVLRPGPPPVSYLGAGPGRGGSDDREADVGDPAGEPLDTRLQDSRPRQESAAERDDRNLAELLQELRVVSIGVQVLFGFLLGLPFTVKFERLSDPQRDLYLTSVVLSAVAVTLLLGPVAYHRVVFRRGLKGGLVRFADVTAIAGLAAVGAAILAAVALVIDYVAGTLPAALITALVAVMLVTL